MTDKTALVILQEIKQKLPQLLIIGKKQVLLSIYNDVLTLICCFIVGVICLISLIICSRGKSNDRKETIAFFSGITLFICLVLFIVFIFLFIGDFIQYKINPEYKAIQKIIEIIE